MRTPKVELDPPHRICIARSRLKVNTVPKKLRGNVLVTTHRGERAAAKALDCVHGLSAYGRD